MHAMHSHSQSLDALSAIRKNLQKSANAIAKNIKHGRVHRMQRHHCIMLLVPVPLEWHSVEAHAVMVVDS
jgi:hypothetical protein